MKTKLVLLGGGGHCLSCVEVIKSTDQYEIVGILDREEKMWQSVGGQLIIGTDADIDRYAAEGCSFLITVGQIKNSFTRHFLYERLREKDYPMPVIIASTAYHSAISRLRIGCIVMHRAVINAGAVIGANSIINTGAIVEHGAYIGSNCHLSTGVIVNGDCVIGDDCFIGSGAILAQGVSLPAGTVIGAGSLVLHSLDLPGIYVGNPINRKI
ncbi:MAG: acetyltransferase [Bacteroides sp.]